MEGSAISRLNVFTKQLGAYEQAGGLSMQPCSGASAASPLDDVVIVTSLRTPLTKAKRGGLRDTDAIDLLATVFKGVLDQSKVEPEAISDIVVGAVLGLSGQRAMEARMASFMAGIPEQVSIYTVNRQCSSGLQAIANVASAIKSGYYTIGIACGVETMSRNSMGWDINTNARVAEFPGAQGCLINMGMTSENLAARYGVDRQTQDQFAERSHKLAAAAQAAGHFKDEIVPVHTKHIDPKTKVETRVTISADDGIRGDITMQALGSLKAVFLDGGSTTAGNASQMTDGAAATLLMTRREAVRRGLPILAVFRSFAAVGVEAAINGIGPILAIPAACKLAGIQVGDIDVLEINEAFASQATYCVKELGIDMARVNPNGGAIALGHPLGATGVRCTATLLHELKRRGKAGRFGVVSMCIAGGMGAAAVFEREG